mmetsp:Transcript_14267/g.42280  ORF Transcript_14267/g.42280 Transcript_14267/m.42280 type:complete len:82 (+) Transcript_14267:124-369(+)
MSSSTRCKSIPPCFFDGVGEESGSSPMPRSWSATLGKLRRSKAERVLAGQDSEVFRRAAANVSSTLLCGRAANALIALLEW